MNCYWVVERRAESYGKRAVWWPHSPHFSKWSATILRDQLCEQYPDAEWRVRKYVPAAAKRGGR